MEENEDEWERICEERLSVSFFDHVKKMRYSNSNSAIIGMVWISKIDRIFLEE
jgi:hypothetical protein